MLKAVRPENGRTMEITHGRKGNGKVYPVIDIHIHPAITRKIRIVMYVAEDGKGTTLILNNDAAIAMHAALGEVLADLKSRE